MDRKVLYDTVRPTLFPGGLTTSQVQGIETLLDAWGTYGTLIGEHDLRDLAYDLATVYHETARTMQPIEEYGKGKGHPYGMPAGPWHLVYDGKGYEQLTWYNNYLKATTRFHELGLFMDVDLTKNPELAMRPDISAGVVIIGNAEGWFTGKKLADYFNDTAEDAVSARRIVNGLDKANTIALYYTQFKRGLQAAFAAPDPVVQVPTPALAPAAPLPAPPVGTAPAAPRPVAPKPAPAPAPSPAPVSMGLAKAVFLFIMSLLQRTKS